MVPRPVLLRGLAQCLDGCAGEIPRQQVFNAIDRMLGDAFEYRAQIRFRIQAVQFRRADQAVYSDGT